MGTREDYLETNIFPSLQKGFCGTVFHCVVLQSPLLNPCSLAIRHALVHTRTEHKTQYHRRVAPSTPPSLKTHLSSAIANIMMDEGGKFGARRHRKLVLLSCVSDAVSRSVSETSCCDADSRGAGCRASVGTWRRFSGEQRAEIGCCAVPRATVYVLKVFRAITLNMKTFGSDYGNYSRQYSNAPSPHRKQVLLHFPTIRLLVLINVLLLGTLRLCL